MYKRHIGKYDPFAGTFKLVKTNLQRLALGRPVGPEERLFIFDPISKGYNPLGEELRQQIENGQFSEQQLSKIFA
jgi:hypothetical protein